MQSPLINTLENRCALTVAHANQLLAYLPFQITALRVDAVDERVGYVLIRHDDGGESEAVMVMNWLCPATVAEAAMRAFIYRHAEAPAHIEDEFAADADEPAPPDPIRGRGRLN